VINLATNFADAGEA